MKSLSQERGKKLDQSSYIYALFYTSRFRLDKKNTEKGLNRVQLP